ncbi:unnamed protein product [Closterium sp. NIES-54]
MDVARTSMIHAAAPHFLWPFAVQYAAHQINLQPRVSLPETTPILRWTGKVGDASAFCVWGSRAFVRDTTADKLSSRAIPSVFRGFPPYAPGWQFYHPTLRRVLSSQDVMFDESVSYYRLFPYLRDRHGLHGLFLSLLLLLYPLGLETESIHQGSCGNRAIYVRSCDNSGTRRQIGHDRSGVSGGGVTQLQRHPRDTITPQEPREWYVQRGASRCSARCPYIIRTGIEATALGASESAHPGTVPVEVLHTFTLDLGASRCFFRNSTTLTPLSTPELSDSTPLLVSPPVALDPSLAPTPGSPLPATPSWHALPPPSLWSSQVSASPPALACLAPPSLRRGAAARRSSLLLVSPDDCSPTVSPHGLHLQLRERFREDVPVLRGEFSSTLLRNFCRGEGILQSFTLPDSPQQNGIAERRIGLVMEVARTSMIHAVALHFLWPFAVWGSCAFVRDLSADKLSARAIPYVFLGFPPNAPGFQFYHPTARRVFPSQDVTYDKSGPAPSGVSQVDPLPGTVPVEVIGDSGGARGTASWGAKRGGAESEGAGFGGTESGGEEPGGAEPGGAEPEGSGGPAGASPRLSPRPETLSPQKLREWFVRHARLRSGATGARGAGAGGAGAGGAGAVDPGATVQSHPYFVSLLKQVLGVPSSTSLTPPLMCPPPDQSQLPLQPASPLSAPSPYTEKSSSLTERREPTSRPVSPVRTARRVPCSRPPPVPSTHAMALRPTSVPLRVPLHAPLESSLPEVPDPESDRARTTSPTVSRLLVPLSSSPSALRLLVLLATAHSSNYRPLALFSTFRRVHRAECTSGIGLVLGGRGPVVLTGHTDTSWVDDSATQRSS